MKNFGTVLKFELDNYFKSKSFMIPLIIICVLAVGVMFIPRIKEAFSGDSETEEGANENDDSSLDIIFGSEDTSKNGILIYDPNDITSEETLRGFFYDEEIVYVASVDELKEKIMAEDSTFKAGYDVKSLSAYDYYVMNKGMFDEGSMEFTDYLSFIVKANYCMKYDLDINEYMETQYPFIQINENILGKDGEQNYWYCYILVIAVFMLIIMYGTTIASSVTNEKSNRSIEILVTTTDTTSLLFGKVFAGVIACVAQVGLILACLLGSYQLNKEYWSIDLTAFLDIPTNVIVVFAIFGIGGFLLYAFLYGALGALVSKIEDLNKTAGTAQMVVTIVYFISLLQLFKPDGMIMKVCSFLPISSYSSMFARVAMGNVATWEIVVSAIILYASVVVMGIVGGKIFRDSTLRYGNPIKLSSALKGLKKK